MTITTASIEIKNKIKRFKNNNHPLQVRNKTKKEIERKKIHARKNGNKNKH